MILAPRWRKVLGDIAAHPLRAVFAVLAMAAGMFGLGAILSAEAILHRELATTYRATRPASATLFLDAVDDSLVACARRQDGVEDAEARPVIRGRIRTGPDAWTPLLVFVVRDFTDVRVDRFSPDSGSWPPGPDEILLERSAVSVAGASVGANVTVRAGHGGERSVHIVGTVHAPGLPPAWMDHVVSGFVGWRSILRENPEAETPALRFVAAGEKPDESRIREVATRVRSVLEAQGRRVSRIDVPPPGRHPHADQMDTFLLLLGSFGALTLVLSVVLVANMVHALLTEQVRQVGVMKAIGASTSQIAALYLAHISTLAAGALAVGAPLGIRAGRGYARFAADILNANVASDSIPLWAFAVLIGIGFAVPVLVSAGPVYRASRISVNEALSGDPAQTPFGSRRLDRWLTSSWSLPRPLRLSLRTALRRRGRLLLTAGTLAAGAAAFLAAWNVSAAWSRALSEDARARREDIDVRLAAFHDEAALARAVAAVPGIARAELWREAAATLANGAETRVALTGPSDGSLLIALPLVEGRWLAAEDEDAVVVNRALRDAAPEARVGSRLTLRVGEKTVSWRVVGVAKELLPLPGAYVSSRETLRAVGQPAGSANSLRIVAASHDADSIRSLSQALERALPKSGIEVAGLQSVRDARHAFADHLVIIESALFFASALVVLVGGLGLTATLTLNVLQRTREIAVLAAMGASPGKVARLVWMESVLVALLGWCAALAAAVPLTFALDAAAGRMFVKTPLDAAWSGSAIAGSLGLVVALSLVCSLYPAWRAAGLEIAPSLSYE